MDIQSSKIELVKKILNIDNIDVIQKVTAFINKENADFWNELSLEEQSEIKKGIQDLDNGLRIEYSEFLKKIS